MLKIKSVACSFHLVFHTLICVDPFASPRSKSIVCSCPESQQPYEMHPTFVLLTNNLTATLFTVFDRLPKTATLHNTYNGFGLFMPEMPYAEMPYQWLIKGWMDKLTLHAENLLIKSAVEVKNSITSNLWVDKKFSNVHFLYSTSTHPRIQGTK